MDSPLRYLLSVTLVIGFLIFQDSGSSSLAIPERVGVELVFSESKATKGNISYEKALFEFVSNLTLEQSQRTDNNQILTFSRLCKIKLLHNIEQLFSFETPPKFSQLKTIPHNKNEGSISPSIVIS